MKIKELEKILVNAGIEPNEARIETKMLIKHFLGLSDIDLAMSDELDIDNNTLELLLGKFNLRIEKRFPVQHIIGSAYFMGEDFLVNENVLIPRDETEILVRRAIEIINQNNFSSVLDIGVGSGCISCIIAKNTNTNVLGVEISSDALLVAIDNVSKLGLVDKILFRKSDVFSEIYDGEKFDLIISNPPYIPISQKDELQQEVQFEPSSALFAFDDEGVEFYKKIADGSLKYLNEGGYLMFELGINQAELVENILVANGYKDIEIIEDLAYIKRVILGRRG